MMGRLRDQIADADPVLARAAQIVASAPALSESEIQKERVRRAVMRDRGSRGLFSLLLRPAIVVAVLLLAAVGAAATLARPFMGRAYLRLVGPGLPTGSASPAGASRSSLGRPLSAEPPSGEAPVPAEPPSGEAPVPAEPPSGEAPAPVVPSPVEHEVGPSRRAGASTREARSHVRGESAQLPLRENETADAPSPQPPAPPQPSAAEGARAEENVIVLAAVRALRREHDARRAGALLDTYLRQYPHGTLVEEALALAIEAASARRDPRAATLARAYLLRFPSGRFQKAARAAAGVP